MLIKCPSSVNWGVKLQLVWTEYGLGASRSRVDQEYVSTVDAFSHIIRSIYETIIMEKTFKNIFMQDVKVAQKIITTLYKSILQSWYQKNYPIIGEYIGIIFVASHPAYQNSIIRKNFTVPFLKYTCLKLK